MDEHRAWGSDGRIIEQTVGRGDGTGTHTRYDTDGKPVETVEVKGLPIEPPPEKNRRSIEDRLRQRLDANRDYLALATPTAAQQRAQVARLTRETNALIRLVLDLLDTDDTGD
jgi:hypothetical protein